MMTPTTAPASFIWVDPLLSQVSDGSRSGTREAIGHGVSDRVEKVVSVGQLVMIGLGNPSIL